MCLCKDDKPGNHQKRKDSQLIQEVPKRKSCGPYQNYVQNCLSFSRQALNSTGCQLKKKKVLNYLSLADKLC